MSVVDRPLPVEIERMRLELADSSIDSSLKLELEKALAFAQEQAKKTRPRCSLEFGRFMRELRKRKGMKQESLAKRIGVTTRSVIAVENGSKIPPTQYTISKWLRELDAYDRLQEALLLAKAWKELRALRRRESARKLMTEMRRIQLLKQKQS